MHAFFFCLPQCFSMHKEPRKVREFLRREQEILDTALKLFLAQGEEGVTVEMIADAVGIGKGTIYKHFKSKAEIANLIFAYADNIKEPPAPPSVYTCPRCRKFSRIGPGSCWKCGCVLVPR